MDEKEFFNRAFSRNLGLLTAQEQETLRKSRIAIAGLGGVGGIDLITLARIGIGAFSIADPDIFELPNINRQYGASTRTFGFKKVEIMQNMLKEVNPFAEVKVFETALDRKNVDDFLKGADVFVDGIDFFSIDIRRQIFSRARDMGISALTAAPLGFSSTLHVFTPDGMSFDEYFDINDNMTNTEKLIAFAVGLAPSALHMKYLNLNFVNLKERTGPSIAIACNLASALTVTEAINLILKKRPVMAAPCYLQFDPLIRIYKKGYLPMGNRNPLQRFKRWWLKRKIKSLGISLE